MKADDIQLSASKDNSTYQPINEIPIIDLDYFPLNASEYYPDYIPLNASEFNPDFFLINVSDSLNTGHMLLLIYLITICVFVTI